MRRLNEIDGKSWERLLDEVLGPAEPLPVPAGLAKRIEERLQAVAAEQREIRRFRSALAIVAGTFGILLCVIAGALSFFDLVVSLGEIMPGALGRFDYLAVSLGMDDPETLGLAALISAAAALTAAALVPFARPASAWALRRTRRKPR